MSLSHLQSSPITLRDKMKIIFSVTIVLLIGALVAVNAKGTDMSKELAELLHQSETNEKVLAESDNADEKAVLSEDDDDDDEVLVEGDEEEDNDEEVEALANAMMDEIMNSVTQSDGEDDDNLMASLMSDDTNEKEVVARLQFLRKIRNKIRRGAKKFIKKLRRHGRRIYSHGRRLYNHARRIYNRGRRIYTVARRFCRRWGK